MPNASETIEKLVREAQTRKILEMLEQVKDIEEAKKRIKELLK